MTHVIPVASLVGDALICLASLVRRIAAPRLSTLVAGRAPHTLLALHPVLMVPAELLVDSAPASAMAAPAPRQSAG